MPQGEPLFPKHGGYRKLKSFQVAELIYDLTVRFCEKFIDLHSRTRDQMIQAARSGVQNIAEGSQASATSKKTELKLTNVARASLEELRRDYEDFLRQHGLRQWDWNDARFSELIARRPATADDVARWALSVKDTANGRNGQDGQDGHKPESTNSPSYSEIAANGALALIMVACSLLNRQLAAQAATFQHEGGFTERLYRERRRYRDQE